MILSLLQGESINIDESIATITVKAPTIVAFGETRDSLSDIKISIEDNVLVVPCMEIAIHVCFASYYIFNISYPLEYRHLLLFLERFIYCLKSVPKLPLCVTILNDNLKRVSDAC